MEISLAGKVAVITGAASGIGRAIAARYLECEAEGLVAVDRQDASSALEDAKARYGDRLQFVTGDVGRESTSIEFVKAAMHTWGRIDVLVCNAGMSVIKPVHEHTP